MKILNFLKSNWKVTLIIVGVIFAVVWFSIKQHQVKVLTEKLTASQTENITIDKERALLEVDKSKLTSDNTIITVRNDSLKKVLAKYQLEFTVLVNKHKIELDELKKIPPDVIYVNLQPIFPNFDNGALKYPFSGSQISGIYKMSVSCGQLTEEYTTQLKTLNTCLNLNTGLSSSITNLNSQVGNLNSQISKCDLQNVNYTKNIDLLNKQVKNKTFWSRTLFGSTIIVTLLYLIK